jgi:hypothetical protein
MGFAALDMVKGAVGMADFAALAARPAVARHGAFRILLDSVWEGNEVLEEGHGLLVTLPNIVFDISLATPASGALLFYGRLVAMVISCDSRYA